MKEREREKKQGNENEFSNQKNGRNKSKKI
jgi:hypothetical protein